MATPVTPAPTLIERLADGAWHSGTELAASLAVSRATISSRVAELRAMGLTVYAVSGRGYRLAAPLELLSAAAIESELAGAAARLDTLLVLERCDSTSAELARRFDSGMQACLAEHQSGGRGRANRGWASPFGANLYLSLAFDMVAPRAPLGGLSLAIGVGVVEALAGFGARDLALKWPNDIWAGGRKLGGILIEHRGEIGGRSRLVIGLGLNVSMDQEQAMAVDQPWARLADHVATLPARNRLAAALLEAVVDTVTVFESHGFAPFHERWSMRDGISDRRVDLIEAGRRRSGIARGIAADGALRIEVDGEIRPVYSGDVSLRVRA